MPIYIILATQRHEGDIAYFSTAKQLTGNSETQDPGASMITTQRERRGATSQANLLWPNGIVYYSFSRQFTGAAID